MDIIKYITQLAGTFADGLVVPLQDKMDQIASVNAVAAEEQRIHDAMPDITPEQREAKHKQLLRARNLRSSGRADGNWREQPEIDIDPVTGERYVTPTMREVQKPACFGVAYMADTKNRLAPLVKHTYVKSDGTPYVEGKRLDITDPDDHAQNTIKDNMYHALRDIGFSDNDASLYILHIQLGDKAAAEELMRKYNNADG